MADALHDWLLGGVAAGPASRQLRLVLPHHRPQRHRSAHAALVAEVDGGRQAEFQIAVPCHPGRESVKDLDCISERRREGRARLTVELPGTVAILDERLGRTPAEAVLGVLLRAKAEGLNKDAH